MKQIKMFFQKAALTVWLCVLLVVFGLGALAGVIWKALPYMLVAAVWLWLGYYTIMHLV